MLRNILVLQHNSKHLFKLCSTVINIFTEDRVHLV